MKTLILSLACTMSLAHMSNAQNRVPMPPVHRAQVATPTAYTRPTAGLSPRTAMLLVDVERQRRGDARALSRAELVSAYGLIDRDHRLLANVLVLLDGTADTDVLSTFGTFSQEVFNGVITGVVDIRSLADLASAPGVLLVQAGERGTADMDQAREQTGVDQVHQGAMLPQAYFGSDVVVGIIDQGFDYTHPNFYNEDGTLYRVKRVWEQMVFIGTPPAPFIYGHELTNEADILNAQRDVTGVSHGTHVAGIAGGAGGTVNLAYRGIAPQCDLVLVSTSMTTSSIADGIAYIMDYASSVGKPCVINMSIGGQIGPHDGLSVFDQYCDGLVGPGRLLVGSASNAGAKPLHLGKTFTLADTLLYTCIEFPGANPVTRGSTIIDIWGEEGQNYWVGVNVFNANTGQFEDWTPYIAANSNNTYGYELYDDDPVDPDLLEVNFASALHPLNNKWNLQVSIDHGDQDDAHRWAMIEIIGHDVQTRMWSWGGDAVFTDAGYDVPVLAGTTSHTVGEIGGTGNAILSVGAYTSRNAYTAFSGAVGAIDHPGVQGAIADFSSKGPTADGRTKPDITAPGNVIMSSVSRFDNDYDAASPYVVSGVTDGTDEWWFAGMSGTSMAAPVVTGILALWLEAAPWLTQQQAKELARTTALTDGHTGTIGPNGSNTWGWGKIDAHQGLLALLGTVGAEVEREHGTTLVYPVPSTGRVHLLFGLGAGNVVAEVLDARGARVHAARLGTVADGQQATLDLTHLPRGIFLLRLLSDQGASTHRIVLVQ